MGVISEPELVAAIEADTGVVRAQYAAHRGDLDEAIRLLDELDAGEQPSMASLDLRARVHAQRGELAQADECWTRMQARDAGDVGAADGRAAIAEINGGRRKARPVLRPGRIALAAVALTGLTLVGGLSWAVASEPAPATEQAVATDRAERSAAARVDPSRVEQLQRRVAALEAEHAQTAKQRAAAVEALATDLMMPGLRVLTRPEYVRIVFEDGLFVRADQLSSAGVALLRELGNRLAGRAVSTTVVGHVVAVPGGRTSGGSVVALARAMVAANRMAKAGSLPLTSFTLVSADQTEGPFSQPARNRTVTLEIAPQGPWGPR